MNRSSRSAYSMFELVVILAIIGILLALLLPAIQKTRQAANRTQSMNIMKQLALAMHNYHDSYSSFPPGYGRNNFSAAAHVLPFLEQEPLFKQIDFKKPISDKANAVAAKTAVRLFLSPGDPLPRVTEDYGATNYLFNAGSKPDLADNDGVFYQDSKTKLQDIVDGTSNTLMTGETLKGDGGNRAVDVRRQHILLNDKNDLKQLTDDSGVKEFQAGKNIAGDRCARWIDGSFLQGTFTGTRPANDPRPDVNCGGQGGLSALRTFETTVNIGICDGSVRAVNVKADPKIWKLLSSRNDGMPLPEF